MIRFQFTLTNLVLSVTLVAFGLGAYRTLIWYAAGIQAIPPVPHPGFLFGSWLVVGAAAGFNISAVVLKRSKFIGTFIGLAAAFGMIFTMLYQLRH